MNPNTKRKISALYIVKNITNLLQNSEDSDSSEDSEDSVDEEIVTVLEILKQSKNFTKNKVTRIVLYVEDTVLNYNDLQFQQHFRVTRQTYEVLLQKIGPALQRQGNIGRQTISIEKQLLAVIWLLATPDSYRSVADRFDMGKSSLSISFFRVIEALNNIAPNIIKWPTGDQIQYIKESFKSFAKLDNVVGAVDGTFVPIKAPKTDPEVYVTRKCNYAITLQAVSDCDLKFIDVFVGYPGSVSDTRIFRNSDLYLKVQNNPADYFPNQEFIIGDKAYPILPWCIPPYIEHQALTRAQKKFNESHSKTRQVIERSFALLFGRFRRLKYLDMNRSDFIPATILAACVMHNFCLNFEIIFNEEYINEGREFVCHNEEIDHHEDEVEIRNIQYAKNLRDNICRELYSENQ